MGCNKILFYDKPYIEKDIRKELYELLFDNEYPSATIKRIENIESDGFIVDSITFNGPGFIFTEFGEKIGEIQYVYKINWKSQMKITFYHRENNKLKYLLVLDFEKK